MEVFGNKLKLFVGIFLLLTLSACSSKLFQPFSTWAQVEVHTDRGMNPDDSGRPSPVVVRLYELSSINEFNQTDDFFVLYDQDKETLADALLNKEEFTLRPGDTARLERKLNENTRYIGVLVAFRNIDGNQWKTHFKLKPNRTNRLQIDIKDVAVRIKKQN